MAAHRDLAIIIGAGVALGLVYLTFQLAPAPANKGNRLTSAPITSPEPPSPALPAAPIPPAITIPEPVAAGPASVELRPAQAVTVAHPIQRLGKRKKARRIAKAKAEPCVGPLCALVTARK